MAPIKLLNLAHSAMAVCLMLSLGALYLAYGVGEQLPLGAVVASHIALIIFPAVFKVGYVLRLTALKQLGRAVN